jgi:hypothetical protein
MVILLFPKTTSASLQPGGPTRLDTIPRTTTYLDNPLVNVDDILTLDDITKFVFLSVSLQPL